MRPALWVLHLALPMLALWLLVARPETDGHWEHHQAHFGLVLLTALVNVALGVVIIQAASRRRDARLFLVALAFLVAAGFLGLHALATPGILLDKNGGFLIATPVGLFLAGVLAVASSIEFGEQSAERLFRLRVPLLSATAGCVLLTGRSHRRRARVRSSSPRSQVRRSMEPPPSATTSSIAADLP